MGAKIIAISDYYGAIHNPKGLPIQQLFQYAAERRPLTDYSDADQISNQEILELECDLLIPAAIGGVITGENANRIQASAIFEAANSPTTISGEQVLADRGIPVFPDILVNAGGVIVSYFEWVQNIQQFRWDINRVDKEMKEMLIKAYKNVSEIHKSKGVSLRTAAFMVGVERVAKSTELRGYLT
jgi:glutamate dehydrogenase (NAD(P)+)